MVLAYNQNRPSIARANLETILDKTQLSTPNKDTSNEIIRLYSLGYTNVLPSTSITSFSVDGQTYEISGKTLKKFTDTYNEATLEIEDLISSKGYKKLTDEQKAKYIKKLYSLYYGIAKSEVVSTYELSSQEEALYYMNGSDLMIMLDEIETIKPKGGLSRTQQIKSYIKSKHLSNKALKCLFQILGVNKHFIY